MMEWIYELLDNSNIPAITALLLGLLTAISPCPLATNIITIGYLGRQFGDRRRLLLSGALYALGRILTYSILGVVFIYLMRESSDIFDLQQVIAGWGEVVLPIFLVIMGLILLIGNKLFISRITPEVNNHHIKGVAGSFVLGVVFSLAFCPTSGMIYFGMLLPMSASAASGYFLPVVYSLAVGLPVVVISWIIAFGMSKIGSIYESVTKIGKWMNIVVASIFIIVGIYYGLQYFGLIK